MIGVIDLAMGNLRSVMNALVECGMDVRRLDGPEAMDACSHLILPGVGHFSAGAQTLDAMGWRDPLCAWASAHRPLLGLCAGMHLLATTGTEGGESRGLGVIPGVVRRIADAPGRAIPHVGWNALELRMSHPVLADLKQQRDFYFAHSYTFHCETAGDLIAETDYGASLSAIVGRGSVVGMQFHPERSQVNGLRLLENFGRWNGRC